MRLLAEVGPVQLTRLNAAVTAFRRRWGPCCPPARVPVG